MAAQEVDQTKKPEKSVKFAQDSNLEQTIDIPSPSSSIQGEASVRHFVPPARKEKHPRRTFPSMRPLTEAEAAFSPAFRRQIPIECLPALPALPKPGCANVTVLVTNTDKSGFSHSSTSTSSTILGTASCDWVDDVFTMPPRMPRYPINPVVPDMPKTRTTANETNTRTVSFNPDGSSTLRHSRLQFDGTSFVRTTTVTATGSNTVTSVTSSQVPLL